MDGKVSIRSPELLQITDADKIHYGAQQSWFPDPWQRQSGCGPTACSHLLWYLSQSRPGCEALCTYDGTKQTGFLFLMLDVWKYVTPGMMGVNRTDIFAMGAQKYARNCGVNLSYRVLNIPIFSRPTTVQFMDFLTRAFSDDLPVAFLNLSNGSLRNLDNWHWVTLVSTHPDQFYTVMYDQGERKEVNLKQWLNTTSLGGGLVAIEPQR